MPHDNLKYYIDHNFRIILVLYLFDLLQEILFVLLLEIKPYINTSNHWTYLKEGYFQDYFDV